GLLHLARKVQDLLRIVSAGASQDRHPAVRFVSDDLHGPQPFGVGQRRCLPGCPAGTEKMAARVDLPAREPTHRRFVEAPGSSERADQRGADPGKWCSHLRSPLLRSIGAGGPESLLTPSTSFI